MFLIRADPLRAQVGGGWALEIETFLGPEMATSEASAIWALGCDLLKIFSFYRILYINIIRSVVCCS